MAEVCIWLLGCQCETSKQPWEIKVKRGRVVLPGEAGKWEKVGLDLRGAMPRRVPEGEAGVQQGREEAVRSGSLWEEGPGPQGRRPRSLARWPPRARHQAQHHGQVQGAGAAHAGPRPKAGPELDQPHLPGPAGPSQPELCHHPLHPPAGGRDPAWVPPSAAGARRR